MFLSRKLYVFFINMFLQLNMAYHELPAIIGFCILIVFLSQLFSGVMISFSIIPEPMLVLLESEEEDIENIYSDDFTLLHERGVDLLMLLLYLHLFSNLYLCSNNVEQVLAWNHGVILFWGTHVVVFFGLVLCCTHLSEITLTIAAQILYTFFLYTGKVYWLILTDQLLNADTLVRLAYFHYSSAFILFYFTLYHGVDMHYDWNTEEVCDGISQELDWTDEGVQNELGLCINILMIFFILCLFLYSQPETLTYELFSWGDIGMSTDVSFFGVAPHWYFSPYMSWLVVCPFYYTGIFGLILFVVSFYFQPEIINYNENQMYTGLNTVLTICCPGFILATRRWLYLQRVQTDYSWVSDWSYGVFLISIWYTFSYLPYGSFFHGVGGNGSSLFAYAYIFIYMNSSFLRNPYMYEIYKSITN